MINVFLDDMRVPSDIYGEGADRNWILATTVEQVIEYLEQGNISMLSLDNDLGLGQKEGHEVVRWMIEHDTWPHDEVYVHSANIVRSKAMIEDVERYFYCCAKLRN